MTSQQTEQNLTCNPCITFVQVLEEKDVKPSISEMSDVASDIVKISAASEVTNVAIKSEEELQDCKDGILDLDNTPSTAKKSNIRTRSKVSKASKTTPTASSPLKEVKVNLRDKINISDSYVNNVNATGFHCEVCGKRFIKAQYLSRHARIHTSEYPYACDTCDKKFYRKDKLNSHLCIHKGELQSEKQSQKDKLATLKDIPKGKLQSPNSLPKSEVQSQKRVRRSTLQSQKNLPKSKVVLENAKCILVVKLQKPKSKDSSSTTGVCCEVCGKKFAARYHLNRHTMIHTGERPFPCDSCDKKFYRKDKLDKHKRTHKRFSEAISRILKQPKGHRKPGKRRKV